MTQLEQVTALPTQMHSRQLAPHHPSLHLALSGASWCTSWDNDTEGIPKNNNSTPPLQKGGPNRYNDIYSKKKHIHVYNILLGVVFESHTPMDSSYHGLAVSSKGGRALGVVISSEFILPCYRLPSRI